MSRPEASVPSRWSAARAAPACPPRSTCVRIVRARAAARRSRRERGRTITIPAGDRRPRERSTRGIKRRRWRAGAGLAGAAIRLRPRWRRTRGSIAAYRTSTTRLMRMKVTVKSERDRLDDREVLRADGLDEQRAEAVEAERVLDQHRARDQEAEHEAGDRDHRDQARSAARACRSLAVPRSRGCVRSRRTPAPSRSRPDARDVRATRRGERDGERDRGQRQVIDAVETATRRDRRPETSRGRPRRP